MYLIATSKPPFKNRQFDGDLACNVIGLRPSMPDSAPEEYKKLAELCCDADPDKRPDAKTLGEDVVPQFGTRLSSGLSQLSSGPRQVSN